MLKRRIFVYLSVCLALGAATTVVVAFACARRVRPTDAFITSDEVSIGLSPTGWGVAVHRGGRCVLVTSLVVPADSIEVIEGLEKYPPAEDVAPSWLWLRPDLVQFEEDSPRFAYAVGWPFEALGCELILDVESGMTVGRDAVEFSSTSEQSANTLLDLLSGNERQRRIMPLRPLGWRFAADSIIFATAWALPLLVLLSGVRRIRGAIRRRRGRCAQCGYALRGLSSRRCPECGSE